MPASINPKRRTSAARTGLLTIGALVGGVLTAGCGGSSGSPSATTPAAATTSVAGAQGSASKPSGAVEPGALAFAVCMRANGVPNFPDPAPGRGFPFPASAGLDRATPAFGTAQAKCAKLMPGGGPPGPGSTTHPSAQTMAKLLRIAVCMRQHGVSQYPDPQTHVPLHPFSSGTGVITDYDGAILLFPSTLDMHSPAFAQATSACGTLAGKLGRGPHSH